MSEEIVPVEIIENKIFLIRGQKVMIDKDIAQLYGVETKSLNRQVRRNIDRFPSDFMFQMTQEEAENLRCQIGTLNPVNKKENLRCQIGTANLRSQIVALKQGEHYKYMPYAFTEHGILMLSSVLRSPRAIQVNIAIMRAFIKFRLMISESKEIARKLELLEKRVFKHDSDIRELVRDIRRLTIVKTEKTGKMGFLK